MAVVVIRLGQSNSRGKAANSTLDASFKQTFANIKTWTGATFSSLDYAVPNNCYPNPTSEGGSEFAILTGLQTLKGGTIYDIKYAVGGTAIGTFVDATNNWNVITRGSYYDAAISCINDALAYMWVTLGIRSFDFYIMWDQGESDSRSLTDQTNYQTNLTNLINNIRTNLGGTSNISAKKIFINPLVNTSVIPISGGTGLTVSAATNATPIEITTGTHGLVTNMSVNISGINGNTAANGVWVITVVSSTKFTLNTSIGNGVYISGGSINSWYYMSNVKTSQTNIASAVSNCYCFDCNSYELNSADNLHYTSQGYKDKGNYAVNSIIIANNL